ncbi:MAG: energy transducer TonB [Pyrinomonadaceae bacterium]|nr:energy transducer TonB [Pyrinomonadaceae bacterium]
MRIILKPPSKYTDAARQANIQGTVRLRVTFLASGGIGSVAAVSELPYGLTEQAVIAASKIVFIPGKKKGVSISMSRIVEYSFSIY